MIFNEIYSAYYNAVARIIAAVIDGCTDEQTLNRIVCDVAFGESMMTVLPSLKSGKWQLIRADMTTPLTHVPTMPLTLIQKQWLKAVSLDPRIRLFGVDLSGLENVEPLFTPDDYVIYDKYSDADPYEDADYIERFQTVLSALRERRLLSIRMINRKGRPVSMTVMPQRLEYSEKDDKFRLIHTGDRFDGTVNLARMISCEICPKADIQEYRPTNPIRCSVTLLVSDERNALERCLLHFAHFEKRIERLDDRRYRVRICYERDDETEMVIRILSFGPMVRVTEPEDFRQLIIERLNRQKSCELF